MNEIQEKILDVQLEGSQDLRSLLIAYRAMISRRAYLPAELLEKAIQGYREYEIVKISELVQTKHE